MPMVWSGGREGMSPLNVVAVIADNSIGGIVREAVGKTGEGRRPTRVVGGAACGSARADVQGVFDTCFPMSLLE